jgi:hypothetical protein
VFDGQTPFGKYLPFFVNLLSEKVLKQITGATVTS